MLLSVSVEFFLSVLSSQLIDNFSDLAEGLRGIEDAKIFVFIFFGAEIGSSFLLRREFIFLSIFGFALYFNCFFVITGLRGRFTCIFLINEFLALLLWVICSKNFFSVS
jgi:hypothetical protein